MVAGAADHPTARAGQSWSPARWGSTRPRSRRPSDLPAAVAHGYEVAAGARRRRDRRVRRRVELGVGRDRVHAVATPTASSAPTSRGATTDPRSGPSSSGSGPGRPSPPARAPTRPAWPSSGTPPGAAPSTATPATRAGFTQFAAATADGTRSVVVQVNGQVSQQGRPRRLRPAARGRRRLAACAGTSPARVSARTGVGASRSGRSVGGGRRPVGR